MTKYGVHLLWLTMSGNKRFESLLYTVILTLNDND